MGDPTLGVLPIRALADEKVERFLGVGGQIDVQLQHSTRICSGLDTVVQADSS